jgi:hypothetical protein
MNKTDKELLELYTSLNQIEKQVFYYILRYHSTPYESFTIPKEIFRNTTLSTSMNRLLDEGFIAYERRPALSPVRVVIQPLACQLFNIIKKEDTTLLNKTSYRIRVNENAQP